MVLMTPSGEPGTMVEHILGFRYEGYQLPIPFSPRAGGREPERLTSATRLRWYVWQTWYLDLDGHCCSRGIGCYHRHRSTQMAWPSEHINLVNGWDTVVRFDIVSPETAPVISATFSTQSGSSGSTSSCSDWMITIQVFWFNWF